MLNKIKNLTDPYDIVAAIKKKVGHSGISACAQDIRCDRSNLSANIHKNRSTSRILQALANWLDTGVHGVMPEETQSERREGWE